MQILDLKSGHAILKERKVASISLELPSSMSISFYFIPTLRLQGSAFQKIGSQHVHQALHLCLPGVRASFSLKYGSKVRSGAKLQGPGAQKTLFGWRFQVLFEALLLRFQRRGAITSPTTEVEHRRCSNNTVVTVLCNGFFFLL